MMRINLHYLALARVNHESDGPQVPQRRANGRVPERPHGRRARYQELVGVGILLAAVVVLLWSGSLITLALGTLLLALLLFAGLLVVTWRRSR